MDALLGILDGLPVWGRALVWGTVAGSGLFVGLLVAIVARPDHSAIARIMSFGAGALFGTVSIQLTISAQRHAGAARTTIVLLVGALTFSIANAWLARAGARHRKRCGKCVPQENEQDSPGSGQAIAIGTMIDALPEGLVLGVAVAQSMAPTAAVVAGIFLANVPESLSGCAGMYLAGRSPKYIVSVWGVASLVTPVGAVLGSLLFAARAPRDGGSLSRPVGRHSDGHGCGNDDPRGLRKGAGLQRSGRGVGVRGGRRHCGPRLA